MVHRRENREITTSCPVMGSLNHPHLPIGRQLRSRICVRVSATDGQTDKQNCCDQRLSNEKSVLNL